MAPQHSQCVRGCELTVLESLSLALQDEFRKRRAPSFPKAPFIVSMAISRILSARLLTRMIIHLTRPARGTNARSRSCSDRGATIPEDFIGPAALPLFCLAPHGVFRASRIAPRAVSSYLAFSPLPALFSKNRRFVFCDTLRHRRSFDCGARVFYAACCRMVFGLSSSEPCGSPAIICHRRVNYHKSRNLEATKP